MMEWKSMGFGWHPISEMENLTCLKPPTRKCPANHGYDMIFYCEPFYQLASLGHIRLAGLPEKIFQDCTVTWLDRMRTPKATKTQQKIEKKNYSNIWRNDSVYCNQLEDPNQLGWSSCSRQNGWVRLVVFSPVFHTQINQTLVILHPNIPMKYYHLCGQTDDWSPLQDK